ncbi:MAG: hypothetical protein U0931_26775 [Vulcanimicrobiota bacterium]
MKPGRRGRGLGIVELVMALALIATALITLITVFSKGSRQAVMSRNRTVAVLLCHSTIDELKAHRYGTPAPKSWSQPTMTPVKIYVEGHPQLMEFKRTLTIPKDFVEVTDVNTAEVTIKIEWDEGIGQNGGHKEMTVKVPVWR